MAGGAVVTAGVGGDVGGGVITAGVGGDVGGGVVTAGVGGGVVTASVGGGVITVDVGGGVVTADVGGGVVMARVGGEVGGGETDDDVSEHEYRVMTEPNRSLSMQLEISVTFPAQLQKGEWTPPYISQPGVEHEVS